MIYPVKGIHFTKMWNLLNFYVNPIAIPIIFTTLSLYLPQLGRKSIRNVELYSNIFGNKLSWLIIGSLIIWAYIWLKLTKKQFSGPKTLSGFTPLYKANAQIYHYTTLALLIFTLYLEPDFAIEIFENMGAIMASLNITAFILSLYLTCGLQDENFEIPKNTGHLYNLVHGTQLYPYIMGISVKQIIVSRLGVTMCQMLNIVNLIAGIRLHGNTVDYGHLAHVLLQGIYFLKSCHLERVLVNFIDFTHDKVGLMLCWGCLVGIPAVQGFTAYLLVEHGTNVGIWEFSLIVSLGIIAIWFNYDVLRQKEMFREGVQNGSKVYIWGKEAKGREVFYKNVDINGKSGEMRNVLLVSGWWGIGRKMNYFWELVAILIWSYPGYYIGWRNYLNCFVLIGIFVSRSIREDNKCKMKYGRGWDEYCSKVPYRFIPFIF